MYTLGLNAAFHDAAACLVRGGTVIAAAEEERFTGVKHGKRPLPFTTYELPFHAIDYCLREVGIDLREVDHVAYSFDPTIRLGSHNGRPTLELPMEPSAAPVGEGWESTWDPLFLSYIVNAPRQLRDGAPHPLRERFRGAGFEPGENWHWVEHHLAHAASAFLPSPFEDAAVLALDGRGELATTAAWMGTDTQLEKLAEVCMPHSLGILYERVTEYLGFLHSSDEYKVMALASYGRPRFEKELREVVTSNPGWGYEIGELHLEKLFGEPRAPGGQIGQQHFDIASSLQVVLEDTVLRLVGEVKKRTPANYLCLAGGVALNCVLNARIREEGPFDRVWVQPAAGDAGTALGAAMWVDARRRGDDDRHYVMDTAYLGPALNDTEIEKFLVWSKLHYRRPSSVVEKTADLLAEGKIVGWFQGRMEFGPRALGARSILASPLNPEVPQRLNDIKDREDFRPVAPVVVEEEAGEWFQDPGHEPFMLFVNRVRLDKESKIPAVRHVDGTARIQTVNRGPNAPYYDLLRAFQRRTGVPVLINTSFNTHGKPIACNPRDALETFWTSPLDALAIGAFIVEKPRG